MHFLGSVVLLMSMAHRLTVLAIPESVPGQSSKLIEVFEVEARVGEQWKFVAFFTDAGNAVELGPGIATDPPSGWEWATDWILDGSYGGIDGWLYARDSASDRHSRVVHTLDGARRRRWVRVLAPKVIEPEIPEQVLATDDKPQGSMHARHIKPPGIVKHVKQCANSMLTRVRDDFVFRGFGLGASMPTFGWPSHLRRTAGFVIQLPITPNFASWERSTYLPMITVLLVVYPRSADPAKSAIVLALVLSVSYPLDALRRGIEAVARPLTAIRRDDNSERRQQRRRMRLGARSVQRVGFSVASRVEIDLKKLKLSVSAVQLRPWFVHALR